jgi:hypothetical protein
MIQSITVEPIISYPKEGFLGKTYLMTVDIQSAGDKWTYKEEEYPIHCIVDSMPLFSNEVIGEPVVVLHRFGGTYGAAQWLLTTRQAGYGSIAVKLINPYGVPMKIIQLPLAVINNKLSDNS